MLFRSFQEEELPHPPGFPTPRYAKKDPPEIRRSPRLTMRKDYGGNKRSKPEKVRIDFTKRERHIEVEEAMKLVEESGTKLTEAIKEMFIQAGKKDEQLRTE